MMDRSEAARQILRDNDRGGYTVPTDRLYPFQWNWDSAFVAMGFASFDLARAWSEIGCLLRGQWEDGMIPQIVFHAPSDDYFPGPGVWGIRRDPPTSGITQPPVLATAARRVLAADATAEGEARMAAIYPRLRDSHRWWAAARDPGGTGLVATLHPWETGMDNSPAWDRALDLLAGELARLGSELRFVLITSAVDIAPLAQAPAEAVDSELAGLKLLVRKTEHSKCGRCWHHLPDVGSHAEHPEICGRCVENIEGAGEVRHYA